MDANQDVCRDYYFWAFTSDLSVLPLGLLIVFCIAYLCQQVVGVALRSCRVTDGCGRFVGVNRLIFSIICNSSEKILFPEAPDC